MAKTTVLIRQLSGPQQPPGGFNYQVWTPSYRLIGDGEVTVAAPQSIRMDANGNGSVDVRPGVWFVTEVVPQGPGEQRAWMVPASDVPVYFDELVEVSDPADIGPGPTYSQQALAAFIGAADAAFRANLSAEAAAVDRQAVEEMYGAITAPEIIAVADPDHPGVILLTSSAMVRVDPFNPDIILIGRA